MPFIKARLKFGGSGDVLIATGTSGIQFLQAGPGNETLLGSLSTPNNYFVAGPGANLIVAGAGNDTIFAGTGAAPVTGGAGAALFVVAANRPPRRRLLPRHPLGRHHPPLRRHHHRHRRLLRLNPAAKGR